MNGMCDLATTVEGFKFRYGEYGYLQIPFCKDPLVVITHPDLPIDGVTSEQVRGIFSGHLKKWKELGGPNERLIIVVPGDTTAAYKNFERQAMGTRPIRFDFMSYLSTLAVKAVQRVPYSISFMGQGVVAGEPGLKTLRIDGEAPGGTGYPYHQVFSFAVEGNPVGPAKAFIDFTFSKEGQEILRKKNMTPLPSEAD
jgi:phosphate transport system substrate-binding protein